MSNFKGQAMIRNIRKYKSAVAGVVLAVASGGAQVAKAEDGTTSVTASESSRKKADQSSRQFNIYLTGYTYWDNTPPGSSAIARPVLRNRAGGTGTWQSPITIAVGHRIDGGRQTLDFPAGTRFYLPRLRKYAIVEDVCGDGPKPQAGPCHSGYKGYPWLDIWIGGKSVDPQQADRCARRITAVQPIILNPPSDLPVHKGEIATDGCKVFG